MTPARLVVLLLLPACAPDSALVAPSSRSPARVLEPGCAGSPYATIQAAIDDAVDLDVIDVCPGVYHERLSIVGKELTLRARDGALTATIDAQTFGRALDVSAGATVTVDGLELVNGLDATSGGVIQCTDATLDVTAARIADGVSGVGGGLSMSNCSGTIADTLFEGNSGWSGGGVHVTGGGTVTLTGLELRGNDADFQGGGIYTDGDVDIIDCLFDANHSYYGGGAYANASYAEMSGGTYTNNTSDNDGGGLYVFAGAPLVSANYFEANDSSDEGGALRLKLSTGVVDDNTFVNNHADYRGGAIKVSHEAITMDRNTYIGNSAWVYGGALFMKESASVLTGDQFEGNTAQYGGAVSIDTGWGPLTIQDASFRDNHATDNGGHLHLHQPGQNLRLVRLDLEGGTADVGGAVYAYDSQILLRNVRAHNNDASVSGGAVYVDATATTVTNSVFWRNTSPVGSALHVYDGVGADVVNSVFGLNTTGAAIEVASGTVPAVSYSVFHDNTADVLGMTDPIGVDGNKSGAPRFRNPGRGNFHLKANSKLIDLGDPSLSDPDGSRSDIGAYGGPDAH
ncbi:MAG: hypothetical protein R3F59_07435 [Myxococcota bacterium]